MFEIRQRLGGLCLTGKIVPEHCTTILKAALQKLCVWPWKCWISLDTFSSPEAAIHLASAMDRDLWPAPIRSRH